VELVSGATIMGDGGVALILDVTRILRGDLRWTQLERPPVRRRATGLNADNLERAA
jgi:chemotaxis protein histidine kinase CheA